MKASTKPEVRVRRIVPTAPKREKTSPRWRFSKRLTGSRSRCKYTLARHWIDASAQHARSRFTQPSDQENNPRTFTHGLPFLGAPANAAATLNLERPKYNLVNLSAGMDFERGLSATPCVNNLTGEKALLSFDRERGGRARLGFATNQPRTIGVTIRKTI